MNTSCHSSRRLESVTLLTAQHHRGCTRCSKELATEDGRSFPFIASQSCGFLWLISLLSLITALSACKLSSSRSSKESSPLVQVNAQNAIRDFDEATIRYAAEQRATLHRALSKLQEVRAKTPNYQELTEPGGVGPYNDVLAMTYYDRASAFYQIADRTHDSSWLGAGDEALTFYRDYYISHPQRAPEDWGRIPGYWNFSDGLTAHFLRTHDPLSKKAILLLSDVAPFASEFTAEDEKLESIDRSREVAYALNTLLNVEKIGEPRRSRREILTSYALGHVAQWNGTAPFIPFESKRVAIRPFMMALTAKSLIRVYEETKDADILASLEAMCDTIWTNNWSEADKALTYANRSPDPDENLPSDGTELQPAPDLHLLIFPLYAWVAQQTDSTLNRDRALLLLSEGTKRMFWTGPKQFNQALFWSISGLRWLTP